MQWSYIKEMWPGNEMHRHPTNRNLQVSDKRKRDHLKIVWNEAGTSWKSWIIWIIQTKYFWWVYQAGSSAGRNRSSSSTVNRAPLISTWRGSDTNLQLCATNLWFHSHVTLNQKTDEKDQQNETKVKLVTFWNSTSSNTIDWTGCLLTAMWNLQALWSMKEEQIFIPVIFIASKCNNSDLMKS